MCKSSSRTMRKPSQGCAPQLEHSVRFFAVPGHPVTHPEGASPMSYDLECRDVVRPFGNHVAVDCVSLGVKQGSFFSILGPSGCGKTTLLRMVAGFGQP